MVMKPGGLFIGATNGSLESQLWLRTPDNSNQRFLHDISSLSLAFQKAGFQSEKIMLKSVDKSVVSKLTKGREDPASPSDGQFDRSKFIQIGFTVRK
jgi:hypothetical protein